MSDPTRGTVVVLDDDEHFRMTVRTSLRSSGFMVYEAEDVAVLNRLFDAQIHVDVLVADNVLPDGNNGWQVAQDLVLRFPDLKVLYMSGYDSDAIEGFGNDVNHRYLLKGSSGLEVVNAVIQAMGT